MAMQSTQVRIEQLPRSALPSARPTIGAPVLGAMCLLAAVVALGLLGHPRPDEAGTAADAWIAGP